MTMLTGTPVVFLFFAGRAGGGFLQSLLDGHEQILMVPTELQFHKAWRRLDCDRVSDARALADLLCTASKLVRLRTGIHYGVESGANVFTPCDPALFRERLEVHLRSYGLSRRAAFLAVHHAYADATGQDLSKIRLVLEMPAYAEWIPDCLEDFPDARIIQIVRDHRGNYASYLSQLPPVPVLADLRAGLVALNRAHDALGDRFHVVRLEDLHLANARTILALAAWLGVEARSSLTKSTLGGVPWLGNSSTGKPVRGVSPDVLTRWRRQLGPREIRVVEAVVGDDLPRHGYAPEEGPRPFGARIAACLLPLPGETDAVPAAHPILLAARRLHPRLPAVLRAVRHLPRLIAGRIRLIRFVLTAGEFALTDRERRTQAVGPVGSLHEISR